MKVSTLRVSQSELRKTCQIAEMIKFVKEGGFWTVEELKKHSTTCLPIQINEFEDSWRILHDGHHRLVSTYLAGRDYIRPDEYQITKWTYADYMEINHPNGWYTPFDPRTHMRVADISKFKNKAKKLFSKDEKIAIQWIKENRNLFCSPIDKIKTVSDLAKKYD